VLGQTLLARGIYHCVIANLQLMFRSSVMLSSSDTSGTRYNSTLPNNSEELNPYHNHCEKTKSHRLWLPVTKLRTVIITALAAQVVTAFSRQGQFYDCDGIILLPLGTELLYSDCMTCHSASGYNNLQVHVTVHHYRRRRKNQRMTQVKMFIHS